MVHSQYARCCSAFRKGSGSPPQIQRRVKNPRPKSSCVEVEPSPITIQYPRPLPVFEDVSVGLPTPITSPRDRPRAVTTLKKSPIPFHIHWLGIAQHSNDLSGRSISQVLLVSEFSKCSLINYFEFRVSHADRVLQQFLEIFSDFK